MYYIALKLDSGNFFFAVESVLKSIDEIGKEIDDLHYREHKRIAIQGIISAIRCVSFSDAAEEAPEEELAQVLCVRVNVRAARIVIRMKNFAFEFRTQLNCLLI